MEQFSSIDNSVPYDLYIWTSFSPGFLLSQWGRRYNGPMIPFPDMLSTVVTALLGGILGSFAARWFSAAARGVESGGLVVLGAVTLALPFAPLVPGPEILGLVLVLGGLLILGRLYDEERLPFSVLFPYLLLLLIIGALCGLQVPAENRWVRLLLSLLWPLSVIFCLKLASVIEEMPPLLCLGSGLTFLLFFPTQQATPPWAVVLTLALVSASLVFLWRRYRGHVNLLGESGLYALGWLLAAVSMLGRSKSLLMFALLVPSMVVVFPFVLICMLILLSYVGNELYMLEAREESAYRWSLPRKRLILLSGIVFLVLNFLLLLWDAEAGPFGYFALGMLLVLSLISFWRAFAGRERVRVPEIGSRISILGVPVSVQTTEGVVTWLKAEIAERKGFRHLVTADSLAIMRARRDERFRAIMERASLAVADGAGLIWAADFLGTPLPARVPGIGLVSEICRVAGNLGWKLYIVGSRPGVADKAVEVLRGRFPDLKPVGVHHGFFREASAEEDAVMADIRARNPDIILVAMGVPRQELFISRLRPLMTTGVAIGVGGSFDVISGTLPRAPVLMQRFALEWLFRLYKEPRRLRRMMAIPAFVLAVLRDKMKQTEKGLSQKRA